MSLRGPALNPPRVPTIARALQEAARTAQGLYLVDARGHDTFLPFAELDDDARRVAAALASRGVCRDDRVALSMPTSRDFLAVFFGAQYAGAVPVPVAPPSHLSKSDERLRTIGNMLRSVQARVLVTQPSLLDMLTEAALAEPGCRCMLASDLTRGTDRLLLQPEADTIGVIQFSSGSTSDPKPVALLHRNLVAQVSALEQLMGVGGHGVSWLPMYHDMGLIGALLSAIYQAGPLALMTPEAFLTRPVQWLRAISRHKATVSPAPNFAFRQCLLRVRDADLDGLDLSSWRIALCGGEAVSPVVMQQFTERFAGVGFNPVAFRPAYGLAESSLAVTTTIGLPSVRLLGVDADVLATEGRAVEPRGTARELLSVGVAAPGAEVEIRGPGRQVLPDGVVGRICTRSPSVMAGYFRNAEATAASLQDGWLDTGDLGFTHDGELFICGRAKDVVIIRGSNHSPTEFEDCLNDLEGLRSGFAVIAAGFVPPGGTGEELLLLVERGVDAPDDLPRRIANAVLDKTGIKPHTVQVVERGELPRTTSGKLRRVEALRRYLAGELKLATERAAATTAG